MTGTTKQIAWAEQIRANAKTNKQLDKSLSVIMDPKSGVTVTAEAAQAAIDSIWAEQSAAWWIDNRSKLDSAYTAALLVIRRMGVTPAKAEPKTPCSPMPSCLPGGLR